MGLVESVIKVQNQLEEYGRLIKALTKSDIQDFGVIILQGGLVCESMLRVVVEDKGYPIDDKGLVRAQDRNFRGGSTPLSFACANEDILPKECREFVFVIRDYRNQAAHIPGVDYETAITFAKALDYFALWFNDYLATHDIIGEEARKIFEFRLFSLEDALKKPEESSGTFQETRSTISYVREEAALYGTSSGSKTVEMILLQKLAEQTELIVNLTKQVNRVEERGERIEHKVDEIHQQIKELTVQISAYQSLVERQVEKAASNEEIDRIMQAYADECADRIVSKTRSTTEKTLYEQEKRKLVISLGESAWKKMDNASQTFLISAKVMYNHLIMLDDIIDYSGVCVLVTKALEVEMDKRFYSKFLDYLDRKYHRDYSKYPTALLFQNRAPLNSEKFTMGSIAFVLCYLENRNDSLNQKQNNKRKLLEYCRDRIFPGKADLEIDAMVIEYARDVETIRTSYRNPSAHTNELKQVNAEACFNYVLDVEKVLKKMLDSFAF